MRPLGVTVEANSHEDDASNPQVQTKRFALRTSRHCRRGKRCSPQVILQGNLPVPGGMDAEFPAALCGVRGMEPQRRAEVQVVNKSWERGWQRVKEGGIRPRCHFPSGQLDVLLSRGSLLNQNQKGQINFLAGCQSLEINLLTKTLQIL